MSTVRVKFPTRRAHARAPAATVPRKPRKQAAGRTARMLALAHHIERLVDASELSGGPLLGAWKGACPGELK